MDTVLGLSLTSTSIGWALVDGRADAGPTVSGDEFAVSGAGGAPDASGVSAVTAAAIGVVSRVRTMLAARGERLRGIGVTWSSGAAAAAALLLEALADSDLDNVAPVRFSQAAESLAEAIDPVAGATGAAVCVLESASATLVVFGSGNEVTIGESAISRIADVPGWLAGLLGRGGPRPELLMLAGSDRRGLEKLGRRLETQLSMPVFVQAGAQSALARGAALALAPRTELFGAPWAAAPPDLAASSASSMSLRYASALMMLTGGAATLVVSLSFALSMQFGPTRVEPQPAHVSVVRIASPAAPAPPEAPPAPPPPPETPPAPAVDLPDSPTQLGTLLESPAQNPVPPVIAPPAGKPSLLDRVKQHVPRLSGH